MFDVGYSLFGNIMDIRTSKQYVYAKLRNRWLPFEKWKMKFETPERWEGKESSCVLGGMTELHSHIKSEMWKHREYVFVCDLIFHAGRTQCLAPATYNSNVTMRWHGLRLKICSWHLKITLYLEWSAFYRFYIKSTSVVHSYVYMQRQKERCSLVLALSTHLYKVQIRSTHSYRTPN